MDYALSDIGRIYCILDKIKFMFTPYQKINSRSAKELNVGQTQDGRGVTVSCINLCPGPIRN